MAETCKQCGWSVDSADLDEAKARLDAHTETHKAEKKAPAKAASKK